MVTWEATRTPVRGMPCLSAGDHVLHLCPLLPADPQGENEIRNKDAAMNENLLPGPIDFILLEFPDQEPSGATAGALMDLIEAGIIRLYDLVAVRKAADGSLAALEITELPGEAGEGFGRMAGARSGLLSDEDLAEAAAAMEPGTVGVLLIYENAWASPFVTAAHAAGGQLIASARIPAQDIVDALDALEAAT